MTAYIDDAISTDLHIRAVVNRKSCPVHSASPGKPCWWIHTVDGTLLAGVCNNRALKAGMTGRINPQSLSRKLLRKKS